jgi:hypothetical protein
MANAEKRQLLHPHQYGSRKGKMCISTVLIKRISYDHIRQTRTDAIMFDNDASACYDRIIPSFLAAMMSCRAGMTWNGSYVLIRLQLNMEYHVRTAYGVASVAFSNMNQLLLGVMQGAGHCLGNTVGTDERAPALSLALWMKRKGLNSTCHTLIDPDASVPEKLLLMTPHYGFYAWALCL